MRLSPIRWMLSLGVCLVVPFGFVQSSDAAVTIGSSLSLAPDINKACMNPLSDRGCLFVTDKVPSGQLTSPLDGVIVRWRIRTGTGSEAQTVRMRVMRRASPNTFLAISSGPLTAVPAGSATSVFDAHLPIDQGDRISVEGEKGTFLNVQALRAGARVFEYGPPVGDGGLTPAPATTNDDREVAINADVEADSDGDGFGDETQDGCPADQLQQGPCLRPGGVGNAGTTASPADTSAPTLQIRGRKRQRLGRRILLKATCSESCELRARAKIKTKKVTKSVRLKLGSRRTSLVAGKAATVRLRISKRIRKEVRRALKRGRRANARVVLVARDLVGNESITRRTVRLKL